LMVVIAPTFLHHSLSRITPTVGSIPKILE